MSKKENILIVEDDENLRLTLEDILDDNGYIVTACATVSAAAECMEVSTFDFIILDIMLPDGNGYDFCKQARKQGYLGMVLMLTARSLEDDLVIGFDVGADDYLTKPYRTSELVARVKALLRRNTASQTVSASLLNHAGQYVIDRRARQVTDSHNHIIDLTPKEFDLLVFFLDRPHQALHRQTILDHVWGTDRIVDSRTVDNFVSALKKKLQLTRAQGTEIQTVRGVGYRLDIHDKNP